MERRILALISLVIVLLVVGGGTVHGFYTFGQALEVRGYLRSDMGIRLQDGHPDVQPDWEEGDLYLFRNTFQLETNLRLTERLKIHSKYRAFYDAAMDVDSDLKERIREDQRSSFIKNSDLREVYADIMPDNWLVRVGKQQIVWGESDGFRMADIINPLDFSWQYFFPSWEDIRIPLWAVRTMHYSGPLTTEFVFVPNVIDEGFRTAKFAPAGANWAFAGLDQFLIDAVDASTPDKNLDAAEYGMRLKYVNPLTGMDVGVFGYYARHKLPTLREDWLGGYIGGDKDVIFAYPYVMSVGGTFNYQMQTKIPGFQAPVLRGEAVYNFDEPFNSTDMITNPRLFKKDTISYMLGYDGNFFNRTLNPTKSFYHSGQIFQKYVLDDEVGLAKGLGKDNDFQTLITFFISTDYMAGRLEPSVFAMYNPSGEWWARPQLTYKYLQDWQLGIAYHYIDANNLTMPNFGFCTKNDQVVAWIRYSW